MGSQWASRLAILFDSHTSGSGFSPSSRKRSLQSGQGLYLHSFRFRNMVEIECPLCAESIDLGMAKEGEYECPYCEDVFHWEPDEFRDIKDLQCPKGCGQLSFASYNRSILSIGGLTDRLKTDKIGHYKCHKCKGSLLNVKNMGTIFEANSDKVRTLESLLEQGVPCDLDCPTCEGKMVEINVYYEPSNPMEDFGDAQDLLTGAIHAGDWRTSNRVRGIQAQLCRCRRSDPNSRGMRRLRVILVRQRGDRQNQESPQDWR